MSVLPNSFESTKIKYETIHDSDNLVIGNCTMYGDSELFVHYHDIDEIYIITEGVGYVYTGQKWEPAKKGDIFKFKSKTYHCAKTEKDSILKFTYVFFEGPFNTIKYHGKSNL